MSSGDSQCDFFSLVSFLTPFYILDRVLISPFKLNISKDDFFPSLHAQLSRFVLKITSPSLYRCACTFCFLHRRSPLNLIASVTLWGEKKCPLKCCSFPEITPYFEYVLRLHSKEKKKITLSTAFCHSYIKLQHGAAHLSSPLGLCSRSTMSVQRIIDIQPL